MVIYKLKKEFKAKHPFRTTVFKDGASYIFDSSKPFTEKVYKLFPEYIEEIVYETKVIIEEPIQTEELTETPVETVKETETIKPIKKTTSSKKTK